MTEQVSVRNSLKRPRVIFFDLDQTLLQHTRPVLSYARTALKELEPDRSAADIANFEAALASVGAGIWGSVAQWRGEGERVLTAAIAKALDQSDYSPQLASPLLTQISRLTAESIKPSQGAYGTLDGLSASGIRVGIITNGFSVLQNYKARCHGFLDRVEALISSEDAGAHKPDARIFEFALEKLNVRADESWFVGDSLEKDVYGATSARLTSILYDPDRLFIFSSNTIRPDHVISNLMELVSLAS